MDQVRKCEEYSSEEWIRDEGKVGKVQSLYVARESLETSEGRWMEGANIPCAPLAEWREESGF